MIKLISQNPYRLLGVLSNSPLKDRVGNQNRLMAFAKIGKEVSFPNDFASIISEKPIRTNESIAAANAAINLDNDRLKYAFLWFISGSPIDNIALKHLQIGNREKALEIFQKKETYSSLINSAVLAFISGDVTTGVNSLSKVIHNRTYRDDLSGALGITRLTDSESEIAERIFGDLLKEIPANQLLAGCTDPSIRAIIIKRALDKPISDINAAVAIAKNADVKAPYACLSAGKQLMNLTKGALQIVKELAGASSPQYQMVADNVAKQVLQCSINYYNNAPDADVESPRQAMFLQSYALSIAVGQLTKDRCKQNYDILKRAVDNMPPAEVAIEASKVKEELCKFNKLPDKIVHSMTLLNATRPLLQSIKAKLGSSNVFYLSLSTQVIRNALHNVIEEVNLAQKDLDRLIEDWKKYGISPSFGGPTILDTTLKSTLREAWTATRLMDSFDMESEFKTKHYNPNRQLLKEMCDDLGVAAYSSSSSSRSNYPSSTTSRTSSTRSSSNYSKAKDSGWLAFWIATLICAVIGAISGGVEGFFVAGIFGAMIAGNIARAIFRKD